MIKFTVKQMEDSLKAEYKMNCQCFPLGEDVYFFGSELECYKLAYTLKDDKECKVYYSENLETFCVTVYDFFTTEMAQCIDN